MVSTGLPRFSPSRVHSSGVPVRAPMRCLATRMFTPFCRINWYIPRAERSISTKADQVLGQEVLHDGQRLAVCVPQPAQVQHVAAGRDRQHHRDLVGGGDHLVGQDHRGGCLVMAGQVVEQAGQFDGAGDLAVHHLGADAALADQQALVDQLLNGAAHGRAGTVRTARPG